MVGIGNRCIFNQPTHHFYMKNYLCQLLLSALLIYNNYEITKITSLFYWYIFFEFVVHTYNLLHTKVEPSAATVDCCIQETRYRHYRNRLQNQCPVYVFTHIQQSRYHYLLYSFIIYPLPIIYYVNYVYVLFLSTSYQWVLISRVGGFFFVLSKRCFFKFICTQNTSCIVRTIV